jgi:hypothetical protein
MPDPNAVSNVLSTQVAAAAATVWIMQKLKSSSWFPLLQHGQKAASRAASLLVAFFVSIGIGYTWNRNADGSHVLILAIPTTAALIIGAWHWFQQFTFHEIIYQATINKLSVTTSAEGGATSPARVTAEGQVVIPKTNGGTKNA